MRYSPCPLPLPAAAGVFCRHGSVQAAFSADSRRVIMPPTQSTGNENGRNTQTVGFLAAADGEMGAENCPVAADGGGIERAGGLLARACCAGAGCIHGFPNRKAACTREFGAVEPGDTLNDEHGDWSQAWQVKVTPTIVLVRQGKVIHSTTGLASYWGLKLRVALADA